MRLVEALSPYIEPVAVTAMRYWHPFTVEAVETLRRAGPLDEIVLLPLYPHYSYATTSSSLKEWRRVVQHVNAVNQESAGRTAIVEFQSQPVTSEGRRIKSRTVAPVAGMGAARGMCIVICSRGYRRCCLTEIRRFSSSSDLEAILVDLQ